MDYYLEQMIREKNQAFDSLVRVEQAIARRERHQPVPEDWLVQRGKLQAAYDEATWALSLYRFFQQVEDSETEAVKVHDRV